MSHFDFSVVVRALAQMLAGWCALFSLSCAIVGDKLTSAQWVYLMSIPGGKWVWSALFLAAAVLLLVGTWRDRSAVAAAGWGLAGFACAAIAGFYFLAPLANGNLFTLGYYPWILCAIFVFVGMKVQLTK